MHIFYTFLLFVFGIFIQNLLKLSFSFIFIFSLLFLGLAFLSHKQNNFKAFNFSIIIFIILLGLFWQYPYSRIDLKDHLKKESSFELEVISLPKNLDLKQSFYAEVSKINGAKVYLKVKVHNFNDLNFEYAKRYKVKAKLTAKKYRGTFFYSLWIKKKNSVQSLDISSLVKLKRKLSLSLLDYYRMNLSDRAYRFLSAAFLARRELLDKTIKVAVKKTGTVHLLAISGLHIGLLAAVFFFVLKLLRVSFEIRLYLVMAFILFYTFLVGMPASAQRAAIMYSVFAISFLIKRKTSSLNSLSLAGLMILLINPNTVFDLGFQFSFLSVLGILLGYKYIKIKQTTNTFLFYVKNTVFITLFVFLATFILSLYYFGKVYMLGVITNLLLIPFFTLIMVINFIFIIFYPLAVFNQLIAEVLIFLVNGFYEFSIALSKMPFSFIYWKANLFWVIFYYGLCCFSIIFLQKSEAKAVNANI